MIEPRLFDTLTQSLLRQGLKPADVRNRHSQQAGELSKIRQRRRFAGIARINCNAQMTAALVKQHCVLEPQGRRLLEQAYERFHYSARAFHKFLKVARTFADLDGAPCLRRQDVAAALMARDMDREQAGMLII